MLLRESLIGLTILALLSACGGGGGGGGGGTSSSEAGSSIASSSAGSTSSAPVSSSSSSTSSFVAPTSITSLGANGWAVTGTGTTGGHGADAAHTKTVTNRTELLAALGYTVNADGSYSGSLDTAKKIIYVSGSISLNANKALTELTADDYLSRNACLSALQITKPTVTDTASLYTQYYAAYAPNVWNTTLVSNKPAALTGALEVGRVCAAAEQKKVVQIVIPSNTSLIGVGSTAKLIRGNLSLKTGSDNIVIRNIAFEDSFDYFPAWDPTDSFPSVPATADSSGCSTSTPTKCVGGRWNSAYDLVSVTGATHVWIDHSTFSDGSNHDKLYPAVSTWDFGGNAQLPEQKVQHHDGLVDVNSGSHAVTLSYNHFMDHDKTGLVGGTDSASLSESPLVYGTTYHHNYYENNKQRQPRVRFGRVHVYNNYYSGQLANTDGSGPDYPWLTAWTAGTASKLYIENNAVEISASPSLDRSPTVVNILSIGSSVSNYTKCTAVASKPWTNTDCETHWYDNGNSFNGAVFTNGYLLLNGLVGASSSNQPIVNDNATTPYWTPGAIYTYTLDAVTDVKATVIANAGVGKL